VPPFTVELQRGRWGAVHFVYYQPRDGEEMIGELIEMGELSNRLLRSSAARSNSGTAAARHAACCAPPTGAFAGPP
jgi:hypothetical protein